MEALAPRTVKCLVQGALSVLSFEFSTVLGVVCV